MQGRGKTNDKMAGCVLLMAWNRHKGLILKADDDDDDDDDDDLRIRESFFDFNDNAVRRVTVQRGSGIPPEDDHGSASYCN
ncbi:hypothetical protein C0J52_09483 [Blattella germanica]|nr:hypothetical protein C0J52_09483 [Blattella germanica]